MTQAATPTRSPLTGYNVGVTTFAEHTLTRYLTTEQQLGWSYRQGIERIALDWRTEHPAT